MPAPSLPELVELERVVELGAGWLDLRTVGEAQCGDSCFPIYAVYLGAADPQVPAAGFFGGVHGLERIGSAVVIAFLRSLVARLRWDAVLQRQLESVRLVFMPVVNPGGLWRGTRANPNGVDLMRNAPVDAGARTPFLIGGQRLSPSLPWFRGRKHAAMEPESAALCSIVESEFLPRSFSVIVDCHSGFGINDRIWFPFAHTCEPIPALPEIFSLSEIFRHAHPHHRYLFEPQSSQYLAHGDLWDYLYLRGRATPGRTFLPLTLEMGSWLWVKKNPRQILSLQGLFNPVRAHREQRVLRRHVAWLDFVARAACSHRQWTPAPDERPGIRDRALAQWYGAGAPKRGGGG